MLPADARLRSSVEIFDTLKRGRRLSSRLVVLHVLTGSGSQHPARFAFAVGKNVGNSVVRHRTTRRLRHIVAELPVPLPAGSRVVVRALPDCASATFAQLRQCVVDVAAKVDTQ